MKDLSLEELLAALAKLPEGSKFAEALKTIIAAKETELAQKATQYKTLTKTLKETEGKLKTADDRLTKLHDHLGIDEDVEDLDEALAEAAKTSKKGGDDVLAKRLEKLEKARKQEKLDSDALLAEERGKRHSATKRQELLKALTENNAARPEDLVDLLFGKVEIGDDDSLSFTDEKGGSVKIGDGVKGWLSTRPDFVKNSQKPGASSGPGSTQGGEQAGELGKSVATKVAETTKTAVDAQAHFFG